MKNRYKFSIIVISLVIVILIIYGNPGGDIVIAKVILEQGTVEVDSGDGFRPVTQDMDLDLYNKIRNIDAQVAVVLYDSIFIDLEPGTEILLDDLSKKLIKIKQATGLTWIKFTKIAGVAGFEIATPNTVAIVRGTEFGVSDHEVLVAEGEVEVESQGQTIILKALEKITTSIGFPDLAASPVMGEYDGDYSPPSASMPRKPLEKSKLSSEDMALMANKKELMLSHMRKAGVLG